MNPPASPPDLPTLPPLPSEPPSTPVPWRWLLLLTALAALLRFAFPGRPGIWGDEAATYGRVNGSFMQLLDVLRLDGFAPLHYELYWLLARVSRLEPVTMRLWPALAGALTVPALYFLARQLVGRTPALVATLLAATSAYLLYYSRDAKMYAPLWLFTVLSIACFLWWLSRPSNRLGWLCWIAATIAAAGIHTPGLIILAIQPLAFALHPRKSWLRLLMLLIGIAVILTGPIYHYTTFNIWAERIRDTGWEASMLNWVEWYNRGRDLPELSRFTATAFAFAWEWPDDPRLIPAVEPRVLSALQWTSIALGAVLALGLIPWPRIAELLHRRRTPPPILDPEPPPPTPPPDPALPRTLGPFAVCALLAVWIVLPAYATYVISFDKPLPPWHLPLWLINAGPWHWATTGLILLAALGMVRRWTDPLKLLAIAAGLFLACYAVHFGVTFHRASSLGIVASWPFVTVTPHDPTPARMLWMPRYLGAAFPAVLIVAAVLLCRLPPVVRHLAITGFVLVNLANFTAKVYIDPEPPLRRMMTDILTDNAQPDRDATVTTFVRPWSGNPFEPGTGSLTTSVGKYHLSTKLDIPLDPPTFRDGGRSSRQLVTFRSELRPTPFRRALTARSKTEEIIYWQRAGQRGDAPTPDPANPLARLLPPGWTLHATTTYPTFDHWTWRYLGTFERHVYRKDAAPQSPTRPTTRPPSPASRPR